jgi:hypothetical protein
VSVLVSVHVSPHCVLVQVHLPDEQVWPAEQALPHVPQWACRNMIEASPVSPLARIDLCPCMSDERSTEHDMPLIDEVIFRSSLSYAPSWSAG